MSRFKLHLSATAFLICAVGLDQAPLAQEQATPQEVVQKINEAAAYLGEAGEAGLETFRRKDSPYVWKDSYVVVNNCETEQVVAHPTRPELAGSSFEDVPVFGDLTGAQIGAMMCEAAQRAPGGWVEYVYPRPGGKEPLRKLTYAKAVEGTPYVLNGGIYSDDATIEELDQMLGD